MPSLQAQAHFEPQYVTIMLQSRNQKLRRAVTRLEAEVQDKFGTGTLE